MTTASLLAEKTHRFATLWILTRTDGTKYRFTDHDAPLTYNGNDYLPAGGFDASARQRQPNLKMRNLEVTGIIDAGNISDDEIRAGLFRGAELQEIVVDWRYPWAGAFIDNIYWIEEVVWDDVMWTAQLAGISRWLRQVDGEVITRNCRHTLGNALCGVNLASFTDTGQVTVIDTQRKVFQTDLPTGVPRTDSWYKYGTLTFTSGNNNGLEFEVAASSLTNSKIWLRYSTPFNITVGDTLSVYAGCNRNFNTCRDKFTNTDNYGGFPYIPGTDRLIRTPGAKRD